MITFPSIRDHYQQAVESVVIKKSTEVITAVAFHTFYTLKYAALVPAVITSIVISLPVVVVSSSLFNIAYRIKFAFRRFYNTSENPELDRASTLQQGSIIKYVLLDLIFYLMIASLKSFRY